MPPGSPGPTGPITPGYDPAGLDARDARQLDDADPDHAGRPDGQHADDAGRVARHALNAVSSDGGTATIGAMLREISVYFDLDGDRHRAIAYDRAAKSVEAANARRHSKHHHDRTRQWCPHRHDILRNGRSDRHRHQNLHRTGTFSSGATGFNAVFVITVNTNDKINVTLATGDHSYW